MPESGGATTLNSRPDVQPPGAWLVRQSCAQTAAHVEIQLPIQVRHTATARPRMMTASKTARHQAMIEDPGEPTACRMSLICVRPPY